MINHKVLYPPESQKSRLSYGYIIILASFFILVITGGTQYSFGVFFKPMLNEFGWSRAATSGAYSLNMVLMGILGILSGRLCDRFGPRLVLTGGGLLIGLGYLLMSRVHSIWQVYLFFGIFISVGMSGMTVPLLSTVARWFTMRRGLASGIVVSGVGIGITIAPPLANLLISSTSWRISYLIFGAVAIALIIILSQFIRRAPDQNVPLVEDADALKTSGPNIRIKKYSLQEAIRTRQFWIISLIYLFFGFSMQTVMVHIVAYSTDLNISAAASAIILSIIGFVSIGSKVGMGSLGDKTSNRNAMILVFTLLVLSLLWLRFSGDLWMLYLFAVIYGLGYGGFGGVQSPLIAEYFGLEAHGAIFGAVTAAGISIGGSLGPLVTGYIFDISNSYHWAFILCAFLSFAGLIFTISLKSTRN
jgi:MFS family permease